MPFIGVNRCRKCGKMLEWSHPTSWCEECIEKEAEKRREQSKTTEFDKGGKKLSSGMTTLAQCNSFRIRKCEEGTIQPYLIEKSIGVNKAGIEQWVGLDGSLSEKEWDDLRRAVIEASYAEEMKQ